MGVQGRAATMKKIPDITEQALKKALGELERSIRDTKREARATDERVASMDSQRAQLADEVASANDRSAHLYRDPVARVISEWSELVHGFWDGSVLWCV